MKEPTVSVDLAKSLGLLPEEYSRILEILGRVPTYTELGIFSVMWSEHCSYKNSIQVLKTMPRTGRRLLVAAGEENAGLVDIGDGLAVAFKIESHNHPSAIEPYQGAATGVGGIMRDIFTMGARPVAALNSLRFGRPEDPHVRHIVKGVVGGIGEYGNSFGVPTVAGEVYFEDCYRDNPLVNAMAVGIVPASRVARAVAQGEGNQVMIVGSATGRDGIHGATFASEELSEQSGDKRPSVQVGDPFTEKLLLEATLEAIEAGHLIGIQDMGAAGITCSTSEMSARGESGMEIDLDLVPARESGMSAYELMLSESQERMLLIVRQGHEGEVKSIYEKWDLQAVTIGRVTKEKNLRIFKDRWLVAEIPAAALVLGGGAPVYLREAREPPYLEELRRLEISELPVPGSMEECLLKMLASPSVASKRWVFEQYDTMVRTNTLPDGFRDAAVIRLKGSQKGLALTTDCNGRYCYLNPRRGGAIAVAEAARNVVCTGALPVAITNCLNFGNPYKPEIFWQFREAVEGISEACRVLDTPVTGGNVSFYNESPDGAVYPTPVIGMLGIIEDISLAVSAEFKDEGDIIFLFGRTVGHMGGSEYLKVVHDRVCGDAPPIDLAYEKRLHKCLLELMKGDVIKSAHDVSEGGIAVALAEACIHGSSPMGARVQLDLTPRPDIILFGEDQSRVIVCVGAHDSHLVYEIARKHVIDVREIGQVGGTRLEISNVILADVQALREAYDSLARVMSGQEKG